MELFEVAKRVRKGAQLLDKKFGPGWRKVLQKHEDEFDFKDGDHCVLGTLEHHYGKMRRLKIKGSPDIKELGGFFTALNRLRIEHRDEEYGFNRTTPGWNDSESLETFEQAKRTEWAMLSDLWRAEFGATE
jgi:hypothetical protein